MSESIAATAGRNMRQRRLKAGKNLQDVAAAAGAHGLRWSTGRVGDLESGRATPNLEALLVAAAALSEITGQQLTLADLFAGSGTVELADGATITRAALRAMLRGRPVKLPTVVPPSPAAEVAANVGTLAEEMSTWPARLRKVAGGRHYDTLVTFKESDDRLARQLGISRSLAMAAMADLWGRSLSAQRDLEAGAGVNAQTRGRITRRLKADLLRRIKEGETP